MNNTHFARLNQLIANNQQNLICGGLKGIEKESLRVTKDGMISHKPHPESLGSALTHPYITTDYSEALIELITPPFVNVKETLNYLAALHHYVYQHLDNEMLLCTSMPCGIDGDESIPIAQYGSSNIGKMKHIYRHGLWHRYGRTMQAIAGIHFNFSVPEALWPVLFKQEKGESSLDAFKASHYFGLVRNFQRMGWIILYLFGASPAICKSFFSSRPRLIEQFEEFDDCTVYHPYATSLRMSDIGYKSKNQANLKINYNSLAEYVDSLTHAIGTPYPDYEKIGVVVDGQYRQLNANVLQIENEFYSIIRPKQIAESCEKPTLALKRRGVRYVEMRSLDLDLFTPLGIDESKACFIEALLLTCLLQESPPMTEADFVVNNRNQLQVANNGRKPGLTLERKGQTVILRDWANEILDSMQDICAILDQDDDSKPYTQALTKQQHLVANPDLTPSARLLAGMQKGNESFGVFSVTKSRLYAKNFIDKPLAVSFSSQFDELAKQSLLKQKEPENKAQLPFDEFLKKYFEQQ